MSRHDDRVYLAHMRDFVHTAQEISKGKKRGDLDADRIYRYALLHVVSVLGEAASKLSAEFRTTHNDIPWGAITGMRNRLIHGYDSVNLDLLWETVQSDLPDVLAKLDALLDE